LLLRDYLEDVFNKSHVALELQYSAKFMVDQIILEKNNEPKTLQDVIDKVINKNEKNKTQ
jgi:non-canonical (house-cleaning) NTP pyrophosphatase